MSSSWRGNIIRNGNLNRILEMTEQGFSASDIRDCFATEKIQLALVNGDFPLVKNNSELTRKALPKRVARSFGENHDAKSLSRVYNLGPCDPGMNT
ncbi:unnamed protein product [Brugia timori]|uniref:LEM domain-containing protein n=1 Tax=Brugia timori TaxID=42155 RepID=A0A0R3QES8_9BILA|nr:unnamed protein product [Brugia timori]